MVFVVVVVCVGCGGGDGWWRGDRGGSGDCCGRSGGCGGGNDGSRWCREAWAGAVPLGEADVSVYARMLAVVGGVDTYQ